MSALGLPAPRNVARPSAPTTATNSAAADTDASASAVKPRLTTAPPYPTRAKWRPRTEADFGDGGAYPECHVAQYPRGMGRKGGNSRVKIDTTNAEAASARALVPAARRVEKADLMRPDQAQIQSTLDATRAAIEAKTGNIATSVKDIASGAALQGATAAQFVRYTPASGDGGVGTTRVVKLVEAAVDPLEPPKFKHKKVTKGVADEEPAPILHSPPRKVTAEDQAAWNVPPCVSNWKNTRGFTVPLDKRVAADGRGLQEVSINDNFAKMAQALYVAEAAAREEVAKRAAIQRKLAVNEKEQQEESLRALAAQARLKRAAGGAAGERDMDSGAASVGGGAAAAAGGAGGAPSTGRAPPPTPPRADGTVDPDKAERDRIRAERRRERERQLRMEAMGNRRGQLTRDADRDVSERIALGLQVGGAGGGGGETQYDQRLFNQAGGAASNFGADDEYNVYSEPMHKRARRPITSIDRRQ
eukprot:TRINITY_DN9033_c0_g1_i1.p2 TRINITY_DN9033_c0_g1~~TRINITY_DN9033_c0_g1_i1.p2  ORF type:complete len:489 (+),score=220.59 TRINITY_DN9033_c0_g1_i1:44-1468(+)